jgi:hypothetical protein
VTWLIALLLAMVSAVTPPVTAPKVLLTRLQDDPAVRAELLGWAAPRGTVLCGINVLEQVGDQSYAWLLCGDFRTGPEAALLSGGAAGVVIGPDSVTFPRHAHYYEDVDRLFPPELVDRVKQAKVPVTPSKDELLAEARALPARPDCRPEALTADVLGPGGAAGGTYYVTLNVINHGPDCVLTTGNLALWAGGRRVATLDLGEVQGIVPLPSGLAFPLLASVPNVDCFPSGRVHLALATAAAHHPQLSVSGPDVSSSYARCAGVGLRGGARGAAPSR